jgi:hypothetical protein
MSVTKSVVSTMTATTVTPAKRIHPRKSYGLKTELVIGRNGTGESVTHRKRCRS